ncbi:Hypothetical predicted protein [Xyrichtys novacula]|uniref:Uncharacterized protein n=1 Tax=Xyrichtys novacula TaxID=13765 RepID=A0AAV1GM54_XYRNO|nr:Hypothetical predicted protein [Xyrichtys novacula]
MELESTQQQQIARRLVLSAHHFCCRCPMFSPCDVTSSLTARIDPTQDSGVMTDERHPRLFLDWTHRI